MLGSVLESRKWSGIHNIVTNEEQLMLCQVARYCTKSSHPGSQRPNSAPKCSPKICHYFSAYQRTNSSTIFLDHATPTFWNNVGRYVSVSLTRLDGALSPAEYSRRTTALALTGGRSIYSATSFIQGSARVGISIYSLHDILRSAAGSIRAIFGDKFSRRKGDWSTGTSSTHYKWQRRQKPSTERTGGTKKAGTRRAERISRRKRRGALVGEQLDEEGRAGRKA